MPYYTVKVTFAYPVKAVSAEDAFSTVPKVIKMRYIGVHAEGVAEVVDESTGNSVLTAFLNPDKTERERKEVRNDKRQICQLPQV
jgi:hypothetical protein